MLEWIDFGVAAGVARTGTHTPQCWFWRTETRKLLTGKGKPMGFLWGNGFTYYKWDSLSLLNLSSCGVGWDMQKICVSAWTPQSRDDCMTKKGFCAASWCKGVVKFAHLTQRRGGTAPGCGEGGADGEVKCDQKCMCVFVGWLAAN